MSETKYSEDHEWIRVEDGVATIGITDYAQEQLGDVVFVELPEPGTALEKGGQAAVVESAPLTGEVTESTSARVDDPSLANSEPTGGGWFFKMSLSDPSQLEGLMDEAAYKAHVEAQS